MRNDDEFPASIEVAKPGGKLGEERTQTQVQTESTAATVREKEAEAPYVAGRAKDAAREATAKADKAEIDRDLAKRGPPVPEPNQKILNLLVTGYQTANRLVPTFKDNFAGTFLDFPTKWENWWQTHNPAPDTLPSGTPGQASWWQEMKMLDNVARNEMFGASLQPNEQKAWAETSISPGMNGETIRHNLKARRDIIHEALGRQYNSLKAIGTNPEQLDALVGEYAKDLTPEAMQDFQKNKTLPGVPDKSDTQNVTLLEKPPEGSQIAKAEIKGFRFPRETEITAYARQPDATPEGMARIMTDQALEAGAFKPEQADEAYRGNLERTKDFFGKFKNPEDRAAIPDAIDYKDVDEEARKRAGAGDIGLQAISNALPSVAGLVSDTAALPIDIAKSGFKLEPVGAVKGMTDLGMDVTGMGDGKALDATLAALKERYGSVDAIKNTLGTDPAGMLGDVSMVLSGGGTAAARLPGKLGRFGELAEMAGRYTDPLTGLRMIGERGIPAVTSRVPERVRDLAASAGEQTQRGVAALAGHTSGIGGPALREAVGAGFERGRTGAPTARSEAFTRNMRHAEENATEGVTAARGAVANLRQQASQAYRAQMARFGSRPAPLDIANVRAQMAAIKPASYDTWAGHGQRPADHRAWEQMNDAVEHYATQAAADPSLLEPLAMDQFKQDLYDIGSRIGGAFDRDAARIARTAYNGVKDELVRHDPLYAEIMTDYERAAQEAQHLDEVFGLAAARGKTVNIDKASRRLLSIMRNNAYTNYGQRASMGERLAALDPTNTLMPTLAGQTSSAWMPRGISVTGGGTGAITLNNIANAVDIPEAVGAATSMLPALPLFSPRLMGEAGYWGGRAAGTVARGTRGLLDLQREYPGSALALSRGSTGIEAVAEGEEPPPVSFDLSEMPHEQPPEQPHEVTVDAQTEPDPDAMLGPDEILDPETDEIVNTKTGERRPSRSYSVGGAVHYAEGGRVEDPRYAAFDRMARRYAKGGAVKPREQSWYEDPANAAREFGSGALFGFNDEAEAGIGALLSGDLDYSARRDRIRREQEAYEEAHPYASMALNAAGSMVPGLVPGGAVISAGSRAARLAPMVERVATVARPVAARMVTVAPRASRVAGRFAKGAIESGVQDVAYGVGAADSPHDIWSSVKENAIPGFLMYGGAHLLGAGAGSVYNRLLSRYGPRILGR